MKSILFLNIVLATSCVVCMKKDLPGMKRRAEAMAFKLRSAAQNSSREHRSSYKSFEAQQLEQLYLQIKAAQEQVETN